MGPKPVVDVRALASRDPGAAECARALAETQLRSGDLDELTLEDFEASVRAWSPNALRDAAHHLAVIAAAFEVPRTTAPVGGWQRELEVRPEIGAPQAGEAKIAGGYSLEVLRPEGVTRLLLPTPSERPHQAPVAGSFEVRVVDADGAALDVVTLSRRSAVADANGERSIRVLELDLARMPVRAWLRWTERVQVREADVDLKGDVGAWTLADLGRGEKVWLPASPEVPADHARVQQLAGEIRRGTSSVQELAARALEVLTRGKRPGGLPSSDALGLLETGSGDALAHATLFAAVMRANGVPTRLVTGVQRGLGRGQPVHWQCEYLVPTRGWVRVEPQGWALQSSRVVMVDTGVVTMAQEAAGLMQGYALPVVVTKSNKPVELERAPLRLGAGLAVEGITEPSLHVAW